MGEDPKYIFHTGSPSIDEITNQSISNKKTLEKKYKVCFSGNEIILVFHPVTTEIEKVELHIKNLLNSVIKFKKPIIAIAPNSDAGGQIIFNVLTKIFKRSSFFSIIQKYSKKRLSWNAKIWRNVDWKF